MSNSIFPTFGHTFSVRGGGAGSIQIDGFDAFKSFRKKAGVIILDNIMFKDSDLYLPVDALNDKHVLYSFGKTFGQFVIGGTAFIPRCGKSYSKAQILKQLQSAFTSKRMSKSKKPVTISILDLSFKGYITDFEVNNPDGITQSIHFSVSGLVAPVSNK